MKRLALFAAAVAMVSGVSYLSFARDEAKVETKPVPGATAEAVKSEATPSAVPHSPSIQPAVTTGDESQKSEPVSGTERKSEPVAENKPAATLSDVGKSAGQHVAEQGKTTMNETGKSAMPSTSAPTTPNSEVVKTTGTPTSPTTK